MPLTENRIANEATAGAAERDVFAHASELPDEHIPNGTQFAERCAVLRRNDFFVGKTLGGQMVPSQYYGQCAKQ